MRSSAILLAASASLGLSGCGEPVRDDHYSNAAQGQAAPVPAQQAPVRQQVPVRIGELGPSFNACAGAGTTRQVTASRPLPVRAAPFEDAEETGAITAGQRFFICTRSHNQKWLGVVYDESGTLAERCGVSSPANSRQAYEGPCRSGWVSSPFVRLVAGEAANQPAAEADKGG
jgi:starvation-inducible outer membrane lipoprotein